MVKSNIISRLSSYVNGNMISSMTIPDLQKTVKHVADIERLMLHVLKHVEVIHENKYSNANGDIQNMGRYEGKNYKYLVNDTSALSTAIDKCMKAIKLAN